MTSFPKSWAASLLIAAFALPVFAETGFAETAAATDPVNAAVAQVGPAQGGAEVDAAQALIGQQVTSADGQVVGVVETAEAMDDGSLRVTVAVAGNAAGIAAWHRGQHRAGVRRAPRQGQPALQRGHAKRISPACTGGARTC